jgi:hypothetical protein
MKAEIERRCSKPSFSLAATLTKKDKLKEQVGELEDFFKRIFVVDSKKRMTFSNIVKHALFADYEGEFKENVAFYNKLEKAEEYKKDDPVGEEYGFDSEMEPEDESRTHLLKKKAISPQSKHLERELEEVCF